MIYDPKRLSKKPAAPRERAEGIGRIDRGTRLKSPTDGTCTYCGKLYGQGEAVVSSFRNTGTDSVVEEYFHESCWRRWEAFRNQPPQT